MKEVIRVNIHSLIDVITNSSTEIFIQSYSGSIDAAKKLINTILKLSGNTKTADDLFRFKIVPNEYALERICDNLTKEEVVELFGNTPDDYKPDDKYRDYYFASDGIDKIIKDYTNELINELPSWMDDEDYYGYSNNELLIIPLNTDEKTINLTNEIKGIFDIDGDRLG